MLSKEAIRREVKEQWRTLSHEQRQRTSCLLWQQLEGLQPFASATDVMLFHSLPDEVDTSCVLHKGHSSKQLWLPAIVDNELEVRPYNSTSELTVGAYGISEPTTSAHPLPHNIVVVVPAVAFDRLGNRLGRGKGYYDRFLADKEALKIGVGLDFQLYDQLPTQPHDIAMDIVVTPSEVIYVNKKNEITKL